MRKATLTGCLRIEVMWRSWNICFQGNPCCHVSQHVSIYMYSAFKTVEEKEKFYICISYMDTTEYSDWLSFSICHPHSCFHNSKCPSLCHSPSTCLAPSLPNVFTILPLMSQHLSRNFLRIIYKYEYGPVNWSEKTLEASRG